MFVGTTLPVPPLLAMQSPYVDVANQGYWAAEATVVETSETPVPLGEPDVDVTQ
jgi:hypothetical protein